VNHWGFLTKHASALLLIANEPRTRLRDIAASLDVTERTAYGLVADLTEAGYLVKSKDGRRNRYSIQEHLPLRDPIVHERTIGEVLDLLGGDRSAQRVALIAGKVQDALQNEPSRATLLLVDDDPHVLLALQMLLGDDGYRILTAMSALEGFDLLALHEVQVILCDERMPDMTGTDFLARVKEMHPDALRILLSSGADGEALIASINRGEVYRYYTKPWDAAELRNNLREAFRHYWNLQDAHTEWRTATTVVEAAVAADRRSGTAGPLRSAAPGTEPAVTPVRSDNAVLAATSPQARPGGPPPASVEPSMVSDTVASALRALLRIRSAKAAADLLQLTAEKLGATVVPAADADEDALPIDLSLGEGPPLLAVVEPLSPARMELEHILPRLVEDARHAVDLLRQTERLDDESNHDKLTGLGNRRVLERVLARAGEASSS